MNALPDPDDESEERLKTVWLLGAGFSKFLGGPLFNECFLPATDSWVNGWLAVNECEPGALNAAKKTWKDGKAKGLWQDAETCIGDLQDALRDPVCRARIQKTTNLQHALESICAQLEQYMAIATSAFVVRFQEDRIIPERWLTYMHWIKSLTPDDTIVSFNYDRVVEELRIKSGSFGDPIKLHGTVPTKDALVAIVKEGKRVAEIKVPGPAKALGSDGREWVAAAGVLKECRHLVVIGYSFPESDPFGRHFILQNCEAARVTVVLGRTNDDGTRVMDMFKRMGISDSENTGRYAQEYLAEGTAKLDENGRFHHRRVIREPAG